MSAGELEGAIKKNQDELTKLENAIHEDPVSMDAWAALGEYLEDNDDPRGELIALELCGGSDRISNYYEEHKPEWLGTEVLDIISHLKEREKYFKSGIDSVFKLDWQYGFIKSFKIASHSKAQSFEGNMARLLLSSEAGRFIQEARFGYIWRRGTYNKIWEALSEVSRHSSLRRLIIGDYKENISNTALGEVSKVLRVFENLEELDVRGSDIKFNSVNHSKLRILRVKAEGISNESLDALASGDFPELTELEIWMGENWYGFTGSADTLDGLMVSSRYPQLKKLTLDYNFFADEVMQKLADSDIILQLEELSVKLGAMSKLGIDYIIHSLEKFRHLKVLDIANYNVDNDLCVRLKKLLPEVKIKTWDQ